MPGTPSSSSEDLLNNNGSSQDKQTNAAKCQPNSSAANTDNNVDKYEEVAMIGSGAYGTVFKARDRNNDGQMVALKKVRVPLVDTGIPISILREVAILRQLQSFDHPNVVKLLDICHGQNSQVERQFNIFLVFEHVEQDLCTYLQNCPSPGLGPEKIKDMLFQILTGVYFLHSHRVVHRDLKPANILVTSTGRVKVADFGLARIYAQSQKFTAVVVTLWYRAPEVLLQSSYASPIDIWAIGCIFAELYNRKPLFCGQSENDQLFRIFSIIGSPPKSEWPRDLSVPWENFSNFKRRDLKSIMKDLCTNGQELFEKMLTFNPENRISARLALEHEYFKEMREQQVP